MNREIKLTTLADAKVKATKSGEIDVTGYAAVFGNEPVPVARRCDRHADDRGDEIDAAGRTEELRVAEREDPAVGSNEPIAQPRRGRGHADDRRVEALTAHRPEEVGARAGWGRRQCKQTQRDEDDPEATEHTIILSEPAAAKTR